MTSLTETAAILAEEGISLTLVRGKVKNINYRVYPHRLRVSAPLRLPERVIANSLSERLTWVLDTHQKLLQHQRLPPASGSLQELRLLSADAQHEQAALPYRLWGVEQGELLAVVVICDRYRQALAVVMPELFAKWQPIVGAVATEQRIKRMRTRWGTCSTKARRVWLSLYLPYYPLSCTEYVIVHELCHLHHPHHRPEFWQAVERAMPDYRQWHDMLSGHGTIDD